MSEKRPAYSSIVHNSFNFLAAAIKFHEFYEISFLHVLTRSQVCWWNNHFEKLPHHEILLLKWNVNVGEFSPLVCTMKVSLCHSYGWILHPQGVNFHGMYGEKCYIARHDKGKVKVCTNNLISDCMFVCLQTSRRECMHVKRSWWWPNGEETRRRQKIIG